MKKTLTKYWREISILFCAYYFADKWDPVSFTRSYFLGACALLGMYFIFASIKGWKYDTPQLVTPGYHWSHTESPVVVGDWSILTLGDVNSQVYNKLATEGVMVIPTKLLNHRYGRENVIDVIPIPVTDIVQLDYYVDKMLKDKGWDKKKIYIGWSSRDNIVKMDETLVKLYDDNNIPEKEQVTAQELIRYLINRDRTIGVLQEVVENKFGNFNKILDVASNASSSMNIGQIQEFSRKLKLGKDNRE